MHPDKLRRLTSQLVAISGLHDPYRLVTASTLDCTANAMQVAHQRKVQDLRSSHQGAMRASLALVLLDLSPHSHEQSREGKAVQWRAACCHTALRVRLERQVSSPRQSLENPVKPTPAPQSHSDPSEFHSTHNSMARPSLEHHPSAHVLPVPFCTAPIQLSARQMHHPRTSDQVRAGSHGA